MNDMTPVEPVCCDNDTKDDIFKTLNDFNFGFPVTTAQLYAISPNMFDGRYIYRSCLFARCSMECFPTSQYNSCILFDNQLLVF